MNTSSEFVEGWLQAVNSNDLEAVISFYKEDAELLGTTEDSIFIGHEEIRIYFSTFLKLKPNGKLVSIVEHDLGISNMHTEFHSYKRMAIVNGTYDFQLLKYGESTTVPARFTFVLQRVETQWKIHTHHSSKKPNLYSRVFDD
jgi:uncharacterized protein (TIGR02246 family)|tara:strand:+ start:182 stop:610 length:429 start_codon:yes stop_codon:yes gene_type:complete